MPFNGEWRIIKKERKIGREKGGGEVKARLGEKKKPSSNTCIGRELVIAKAQR